MRQVLLLLILAAGCAQADEKQKVDMTLNLLHQYASEANWDGYFDLYHPDAIFIGTDASETWTIPQFQEYAKPAFDSGKGWTYHPYDRHIYLSDDEQVAWFDEMLSNRSLGVTRGTGVLTQKDGQWKLQQYHLAIPIPNSLADGIAEEIKAFSGNSEQ